MTNTKRSSEQSAARFPDALIECPDFLLSSVALTITEQLEEALAPLDLRLRHYRLLRLLSISGPQPQSSIGAAMQVDRTTVVSLVDALESKDLAHRIRGDDRRAYVVAVTPKGKACFRAANARAKAVEKALFAPLAAREQEHLRKLLTQVLVR